MRKITDYQGTVFIHVGCKDCDIQCSKRLDLVSVRYACYGLTGSKYWRESTPSRIKHFFTHIIRTIPHYRMEIERAIRRQFTCKTRMSLSGNFAKCGYAYGNDELRKDGLCPGCGRKMKVINP